MANPNQQLEAALAQFAKQRGITPDQVAQLRAAVTGNAQQLQELNQQAQSGQLRGFALQSSTNASQNLAGTYDIQNGTVTLPASSFQPSGTAASVDLTATVKLQQISIEFAHKSYKDAANNTHPVTQDMVNNLQSTINGSPVLADEIKKAVTTADPGQPNRKHLEHFDFVAPGFAAGGTYNGGDKTMRLPPLGLQTNTPANPNGKFYADDMTFVLGHEIQHGFNHPDKLAAAKTFRNDSVAIAKSAQPVHDYSTPISNYIQAGRDDEAKAEIAGWNALLSRQKQINPTVPGTDLMLSTNNDRVLDFVKQDPAAAPMPKALPLSGLTFNQDGSLAQSPANIAAMGQHYYNRPDPAHAQLGQRPLGIGERGTSDYPSYYGTSAVEQVIDIERRFAQPVHGVMPRMTINMAGAKISEELLEKEGINLGANKAPQPYYDSSQTPAALHHFDHTQDGSVSPTQDHQYVPVAPSAPSRRRSPEDSDHPENALLEKVRAGVRDLDRQVGKPWDEQSERLSASALAMAVEKKFRSGDDVWVGLNQKTERYAAGELLLVQRVGGDVSPDPFQNRAHMSTTEALSQPAEQRYQQVEVMRQAQVEEQQRQQQEVLTRSQNPPSQSGPAMSM